MREKEKKRERKNHFQLSRINFRKKKELPLLIHFFNFWTEHSRLKLHPTQPPMHKIQSFGNQMRVKLKHFKQDDTETSTVWYLVLFIIIYKRAYSYRNGGPTFLDIITHTIFN